jgi:Asp-tRNA(Asn)/Glu-tRNA(Gln) amidotransferase C subunit
MDITTQSQEVKRLIIPFKKKKVKVTPEEMNHIKKIKNMARISSNPAEVRLFREQLNSIINKAYRRQ